MRSAKKSTASTRKKVRPSIAFIGAGALATSLARSLHEQGYRVCEFILRKERKPRAALKTLARELGARITSFQDCALGADILWFAVPDDVTEACAASIARGRHLKGKFAFHSSGVLSSKALVSLQNAGASTASLHPMMSFSSGNRNPDLKGVWFSVEGDEAAVRVANNIVRDLGGNILALQAEQKALYHAFGAMIAPLLVAHLEAAERLGKQVGLDARTTRVVMKPIVDKVIAAFLQGGADKAFSGPFLRGDVNTVERHLKAIKGRDEESLYRALANYAIEHIKVANQKELRKVLKQK